MKPWIDAKADIKRNRGPLEGLSRLTQLQLLQAQLAKCARRKSRAQRGYLREALSSNIRLVFSCQKKQNMVFELCFTAF